MKRLHLIDGTFELYRAEYSKRPDRRTRDGGPAKGATGVIRSLIALLKNKEEAVTHLAVAFDNPIRSFRNDLFDGYKSDEGVPETLKAQFDLVEAGTRALGITVWSMDTFEADDALATAATRFKAGVDQIRIMTPDKDLGQCLDGQKVVQVDRIRDRVIDEAAMTARRGVQPASIPDYLALVGDSADGIPGLPGFGEKSTAQLLMAYGHLEAIPPDAADWTPKVRGAARLAETLRAQRQDAELYRQLATLRMDVPLAEPLEGLHYEGPIESELEEFVEYVQDPKILELAR